VIGFSFTAPPLSIVFLGLTALQQSAPTLASMRERVPVDRR
jgi:hypothetical protein